ncbi:probable E3 ubiquitin-protein ligase ATL44 [Hordeum vulgare subsp. vulgare]|uniref:RING-type E3 ubiquitin transferase n=1 Tax=Hordeum vulgare subsp. vulgare TaxID=112509 RepID=A0A8I6YPI0_HORVV|nr:probable E3 ubiquitin-protein ligase ATL44 [Hordeum vulgare subsp. vulgare]
MRAPPTASLQHSSTAAKPSPSPPPPRPDPQTSLVVTVDSDMVVILASLLCVLVCVLGLALLSRCACRRRSSDHYPPPPKGLKKKAIDALPTVSFTAAAAASSSSECAVCLAEFADGEAVRVLPVCGHGFHVACVDAWLRTRATCPSCRAAIVATPMQVQPAAAPAVVVVVAGNSRCGRCGEVTAPAGARAADAAPLA